MEFNTIGKQICKELKIKHSEIIPKSQATFSLKTDDEEVGEIHYKHFVSRRQKCLLRIADRM